MPDLPPPFPSDRRASLEMAISGWVTACGVAISVLLAVYIGYWERQGVEEDARQLASQRTEILDSTMRVSMQVLYSLQSLHAAMGGVTPDAFTRFARDERLRHPELQALEWAPRVADADRPAFEALMQKEGYPGFRLVEINPAGTVAAAAKRTAYFPVQLIEPMQGNERALGLDLAFDDARRAALEQARRTRSPAATAPIRLAQETSAQPGFLVFLPLYGDQAPDQVEGFVLAVFRFEDLIRHAMGDMDGRGIAFTIDDVSDGQPQRVFGPAEAVAGPAYPALLNWLLPTGGWHDTLEVADRTWQLNFTPETGFVMRHLPWQTLAIFLTGLLVTALTAGSVRLLARRGQAVAIANTALNAEIARREEAVQAALAASRSKSSFLANMSHEIRTPMNAVLGYAQLLRGDSGLDEVQRDSVNAILTSGNHLMNQINEVLDFSKIESGVFELHRADFDVNAMLRDLRGMFRAPCREKRLAFEIAELPPAQAWAHGDGVKLQQILVNLLGNAVRFTSVGAITLRVRIEDGGWYRFDVADTGPGIAEAERERIFEPFYQSRSLAAQGGSGLGLAIAKRQAELMGGRIEVTSEQGVGSVFAVHIPLEPAAEESAGLAGNAAARWDIAPGAPFHALIVDDLPANRDVLARMLRDAGCIAHEAGDADAGMRILEEHAIDVVFMDMRMPGIDGIAAIGMLQKLPARPRIIAYTAVAFEQDGERFLAAGCDGIVTKPIDINHLFATLALVCDRRFERKALVGEDEFLIREPDFARLHVASDLLNRMVTATELHSATVLKVCLEELATRGPEQALLARQLRHHLRAYDMTAIARVLTKVPESPSPESPP